MDQAKKALERRLQDEQNGFAIHSEGGTCHSCGTMIFDDDMWYDKWCSKCFKCQEALNKKIVQGYIFKDYKNEKSINIADLSDKAGLYQQTLKKLVRQDKLKARVYKGDRGELWVFLRKENPDLETVIEK